MKEQSKKKSTDRPEVSQPLNRTDNSLSATRYLSSSGSFLASEGTAAGLQPPADSVEARTRLVNPPAKKSPAASWLLLLTVMVLAVVPLFMLLTRADVTGVDEAGVLARSLETWDYSNDHPVNRIGGGSHARVGHTDSSAAQESTGQGDWIRELTGLIPRDGGRYDLTTPPAVTWVQGAAFSLSGMDPDRPTPETLVAVGRVSSVILALVTLGAVFWCGHSIGGNRAARTAGLVLIACPFFLWHGRLATGTIHLACWPALAIAGAIWAIRPLRPAPSIMRQLIGWGTAGVGLGFACLSIGPVAAIMVPVPIIVTLVVSPRRISHTLGLLAAVLIAGLMVFPWTAVAHTQDPGLWRFWLSQIDPTRPADGRGMGVVGASVLWVVLMLLPWTPWLLGAFFQPFHALPGGHRRKTSICLSWLFTAWVVPVFTGMDVTGASLFGVLPAGALLIGYVFSQYAEIAEGSRNAAVWSLLKWPYTVVFVVVSLALPFASGIQEMLFEMGYLAGEGLAMPAWPWLLGQSAVLLVIVGFGVRWVLSGFPSRAMGCWAVWSLVLFSFLLWPLTDHDRAKSAAKDDATTVRNLALNHPLYWYGDSEVGPRVVDAGLQVYCGKPITPLPMDPVHSTLSPRLFYLLTPQIGVDRVNAAVSPSRSTLVGHLPNLGLALWRVEPTLSVPQ